MLTPQASTRLQPLLQTSDIDEMSAHVATLFGPHRISIPKPQGMNFDILACEVNGLRLGQVGYSTAADVEVQATRTGWTLSHALKGGSRFHNGGQDRAAGTMPMVPPQWRGGFSLSPDARFENLHIPVDRLMAVVHDLLGSHPQEPPGFEMFLPGALVAPQRLRQWLTTLAHTSLVGGLAHARLDATISQALLMELVLLWPNAYSDYLARGNAGIGAVHKARAFMHAHLEDDLDMAQIARAAGVGVRALELAFAKQLQTSPWRYLRGLRLDRARQDLTLGPHTTVLAVASRYGFSSPGLFARYYLQRHGEKPGETRKRRSA
jgi:AraC-like DNA-binding protein